MIYLDTSALAKLIVRETETATLGRWLRQRDTAVGDEHHRPCRARSGVPALRRHRRSPPAARRAGHDPVCGVGRRRCADHRDGHPADARRHPPGERTLGTRRADCLLLPLMRRCSKPGTFTSLRSPVNRMLRRRPLSSSGMAWRAAMIGVTVRDDAVTSWGRCRAAERYSEPYRP